jgi:hypothetical protein
MVADRGNNSRRVDCCCACVTPLDQEFLQAEP